MDIARCLGAMDEFIYTIYKSYPKNNMFGAWDLCEGEHEWFEGFPCLMNLGKTIHVIPSSTVICDRGFSELNRTKNDERSSLSFDTLCVNVSLS